MLAKGIFMFFMWNIIIFGLNGEMYDVQLEKMVPVKDSNPEYVNYDTLRVQKIKRNTFVLTGNFVFLKTMGNEIFSSYDLKKKSPQSDTYDFSVVSNGLPLCDMIKQERFIYPYMLKHSNLPQPGNCPVPKNNYTYDNFVIDSNVLPKFMTAGFYVLRIELTVVKTKALVAGFELYFMINN